jgi:hypothetical protein
VTKSKAIVVSTLVLIGFVPWCVGAAQWDPVTAVPLTLDPASLSTEYAAEEPEQYVTAEELPLMMDPVVIHRVTSEAARHAPPSPKHSLLGAQRRRVNHRMRVR